MAPFFFSQHKDTSKKFGVTNIITREVALTRETVCKTTNIMAPNPKFNFVIIDLLEEADRICKIIESFRERPVLGSRA